MARAGVDLGDLPRGSSAPSATVWRTCTASSPARPPRRWPADVARRYLTEYLRFDIGPDQLRRGRTFPRARPPPRRPVGTAAPAGDGEKNVTSVLGPPGPSDENSRRPPRGRRGARPAHRRGWRDDLSGNGGDDILVAGRTAFDAVRAYSARFSRMAPHRPHRRCPRRGDRRDRHGTQRLPVSSPPPGPAAPYSTTPRPTCSVAGRGTTGSSSAPPPTAPATPVKGDVQTTYGA